MRSEAVFPWPGYARKAGCNVRSYDWTRRAEEVTGENNEGKVVCRKGNARRGFWLQLGCAAAGGCRKLEGHMLGCKVSSTLPGRSAVPGDGLGKYRSGKLILNTGH